MGYEVRVYGKDGLMLMSFVVQNGQGHVWMAGDTGNALGMVTRIDLVPKSMSGHRLPSPAAPVAVPALDPLSECPCGLVRKDCDYHRAT
jgi:hypothetical protein